MVEGQDQNKHSGGCVKAGNLKKKIDKNGYYASCAWVIVETDPSNLQLGLKNKAKTIIYSIFWLVMVTNK